MSSTATDRPLHRVVVLALHGVIPFDLAIPGRIFAAAVDGAGRPLYEVVTCSLDGGPVRTSGDFGIVVDHGPAVVGSADTLVIPPQAAEVGCSAPAAPDGLAPLLGSLPPGIRVVSLCTAAFHLAEAGLLDGRLATTHWMLTEELARRFPSVALDPDVLFVDEGDVLTGAGVAAGIDLCLHLVRRDHGAEVANRAARACVVPPQRDGGQRQYVDRPMPAPEEASTAEVRRWVLNHLDEPVDLAVLAGRAAMSVRTFTRRFREETGQSPGHWLTRQRVELARRLLETTTLPIDTVAGEAGLGTGASLRQHFRRQIGVSPSTYRRTFRVGDDAEARPWPATHG